MAIAQPRSVGSSREFVLSVPHQWSPTLASSTRVRRQLSSPIQPQSISPATPWLVNRRSMKPQFELPSQGPVPFSVEVLHNPTQAQLRQLALEHTPFCRETAHGTVNKIARNKARMAKYTYVIDRQNDASRFSHKTIAPNDAQALIDLQAEYIRGKGKLISIEGYIGLGQRAVPCQWLYTLEAANIAGMQQVLSFPREAVETPEQLAQPFRPAMRLYYTPDCRPDVDGRQAIVVDLDGFTTYVMGPDYFGESKKGALRMLAALLYDRGGLLMHAGAKAVQTHNESLTMGVLGLSGTGKTTTTFSRQGQTTRPVQDDMIALWPGGEVSVTENGCFAKTFGLTAETEPVVYRGTCDPSAWIENVYVDEAGVPDFSKDILGPADVGRLRDVLIGTGAPEANVDRYIRGEVAVGDVLVDGITKDGWDFVVWTENGRSIIPMGAIDDAADLSTVPALRSLGILNRDEGSDAAMPGIVRFTSPEQAAGYLMLGETTKTSAAGKDRGKTRSPFTQPFFPYAHKRQAQRFSELAATFSTTGMWLMNTGFVGGSKVEVDKGEALKVKIRHSSAMLEALVGDDIRWTVDPDFGYEVVDIDAPENAELVATVSAEILQPRRWFTAHGRQDRYKAWVSKMHQERREFLERFDVDPDIVAAVTR
ncbi:MAG: phosphoenolpyruvate carboxykinase (ATP) [Myxococcales bacterium FL481]|nr:MAG: phosphoenolpyruvate carboxykinase (ATP) [Myxococcales bacterium FL481]